MVDQIDIEIVSHVGDSFPLKERDDEYVHWSQVNCKRMQLMVLFAARKLHVNEPLLLAVKIPRNLPIFKVRPFIRHCEQKLMATYGLTKRTNFVLVNHEVNGELTGNWELELDLPVSSVQYI